MAQRGRPGLSAKQKKDLWLRWKAGRGEVAKTILLPVSCKNHIGKTCSNEICNSLFVFNEQNVHCGVLDCESNVPWGLMVTSKGRLSRTMVFLARSLDLKGPVTTANLEPSLPCS